MTNVLLVDDETSFLTHLKTLIHWQNYGYEIVGTAENGQRAMELLASLPVDIVLTDMRMSIMDGAEFIERCQPMQDRVAFIALSGFKDFDYVRKSLRCGAVDYLIKYSLTPASLLEVLEKARSRIQQGSAHEDAALLTKYQSDLAMQVLASTLSAGNEDAAQIHAALEQLSISPNHYTVFLIYIDRYAQTLEKLKTDKQQQRVLRTISEMCATVANDVGQGVVVRDDAAGRYMLLASFENNTSYLYLRSQQHQIASRISVTLKRMLNLDCTILISSPVRGGVGLEPCIHRLETLAELRFYRGGRHIFYEKDEQPLQESGHLQADEKRIESLLQQYDKDGLSQYFKEAFAHFEAGRAARSVVESLCFEAYHVIQATLKSAGIAPSTGEPAFWSMRRAEDAQEMLSRLTEHSHRAVDQLVEMDFPKEYSDVTLRALRAIAADYASDISLSTVARQIDINSAYLSRMFKKDVQKGFVEYLNCYRITMACKLILQGVSLKDVAEQCGFASYNYFFKVFREQKGMTPQEFKKNSGA